MGGEGSISAMITTLRNNKNLLRGRKGFFRRELSYSEIRDYYKTPKLNLRKGNLDQDYLRKVRAQILKDRRKTRWIQITVISVTLIFVGSIFYALASLSFPVDSRKNSSVSQKQIENQNTIDHQEMLVLGLENLRDGKYFFAVGNFENALQIKPDDLETKILYTESLCLLCSTNDQFCDKAKSYLYQVSNNYPDNNELKDLKEKYLK